MDNEQKARIKATCPLMKMGVDPTEGISTMENVHEQICLNCNLKVCVLDVLEGKTGRAYAKKLV